MLLSQYRIPVMQDEKSFRDLLYNNVHVVNTVCRTLKMVRMVNIMDVIFTTKKTTRSMIINKHLTPQK